MANFTDRFIALPITVYNKQHKELTGKENLVEAELKILPFEISEYYPSMDEDVMKTQVFLKNGNSYLVELSIEEFESKVNSHQKIS